MNINIAFNTIMYIMVFLFPGLLFRRVFFSGRFSNNFDSGNSLERILYSLLISIICLFLFSIFAVNVNEILDGKITVFSYFTEEQLLSNFDNLYQNRFPEILKSTTSIYNLSKILFSLYLFSGLLGFLSNWFVHIFGLEKRFTIFQFSNKWHYLTFSNKKINSNHKIGDIHTTYIDIATDDECLFTGRLHDVVISKDGNIEAYTLFNTFKYYRINKDNIDNLKKIEYVKELMRLNPNSYSINSESEHQFIYLKSIKGNLFTIASNKVKNTSLSFIKVSGFYKKLESAINLIINSLLVILVAFSLSYIFWDYHLYEFASYPQRITFCFTLPLSFIGLIIFFSSFFEKKEAKKSYWGNVIISLFVMLLLMTPYLYIFNHLSFSWFICVVIVYFIIFSIWLDYFKNKKKPLNEQSDEK